jgi:hypothetical protein
MLTTQIQRPGSPVRGSLADGVRIRRAGATDTGRVQTVEVLAGPAAAGYRPLVMAREGADW